LDGNTTLVLDDGQLLSEGIDSGVKAEYAQTALQDTKLHKNRTLSLPVPLNDEVAQNALDELAEDISARNDGDIAELEEQINEAVFELYRLSEEDVQEHVHRYNRQHESVKPLDIID